MKQLTKNLILATIVISIIIVTTFIIVGKEMKEAEEFCIEVVNGTYTFKNQFHYCNDKQISKYYNALTKTKYWRFVNLYDVDLELLQNDTED